jgi:hypothetical protein
MQLEFQVPMLVAFGMMNTNFGSCKTQTAKENISEILKGYQRDENAKGYEF